MADITIINNWFGGELVNTDDMGTVNQLLLSNLFASNQPGSVFNVIPTVDTGTMTFSVTSGYAFFGVTADTTYIDYTDSTTLGCTVEAQGSLTLVDTNCYIYIEPDISYITANRYTEIAGIAYSSTNPSDVGIKICDIVDGVATNFNANNIDNYFSISDNFLTPQNPDGSNIILNVYASAWNRITILSTSDSVTSSDGFVLFRPADASLTLTADSTMNVFRDGFTFCVQTTATQGITLSLTNSGGNSSITLPAGTDGVTGNIYCVQYSKDQDNFSINGIAQGAFSDSYSYLPDGKFIQWGTISITNPGASGSSSNTATFPVPFTNAMLSLSCSAYYNNGFGAIFPFLGNYSACGLSGDPSNPTSIIGSVANFDTGGPNVILQYTAIGY